MSETHQITARTRNGSTCTVEHVEALARSIGDRDALPRLLRLELVGAEAAAAAARGIAEEAEEQARRARALSDLQDDHAHALRQALLSSIAHELNRAEGLQVEPSVLGPDHVAVKAEGRREDGTTAECQISFVLSGPDFRPHAIVLVPEVEEGGDGIPGEAGPDLSGVKTYPAGSRTYSVLGWRNEDEAEAEAS